MRALVRNVIANTGAAGAGILVALISTPLIIDHVGRSGYGVWTISMAFVVYLAIAEAGLAPSAQRFVAVSQGAGDLGSAARILWSSLAAYLTVGIVVGAAIAVAAPAIAGIFDFPPALENDAEELMRLVAIGIPLALAGAALTNVQQGLGRFPAATATTVLGALTYLAVLVALILNDASLGQLGLAVIAQQTVILLARIVVSRDVLLAGRPAFVSRAQAREMLAFSGRLQASVLSLLINGQSDKVVVGLVAPPATVASVGIAAQVAEAGRLIAAAPLVPIISRLGDAVGAADSGRLHREFSRLDRLWSDVVVGGVVIGAACAYPLLTAWLGDGYGEASAFAAMLIVAYGVNVLAGVRLAYMRAVGRIGLEARSGLLLIALNVGFTIPLAIAFAAPGVVGGTLAAYLLGTAWVYARFAAAAPEVGRLPAPVCGRAVAFAVPAAAGAAVVSLGIVSVIPRGLSLPFVVAVVAAALILQLAGTLRVRPTPAALRAAVMALARGQEPEGAGASRDRPAHRSV